MPLSCSLWCSVGMRYSCDVRHAFVRHTCCRPCRTARALPATYDASRGTVTPLLCRACTACIAVHLPAFTHLETSVPTLLTTVRGACYLFCFVLEFFVMESRCTALRYSFVTFVGVLLFWIAAFCTAFITPVLCCIWSSSVLEHAVVHSVLNFLPGYL